MKARLGVMKARLVQVKKTFENEVPFEQAEMNMKVNLCIQCLSVTR